MLASSAAEAAADLQVGAVQLMTDGLLVLAGDPEVVAEESEGEIKVCPDKALGA